MMIDESFISRIRISCSCSLCLCENDPKETMLLRRSPSGTTVDLIFWTVGILCTVHAQNDKDTLLHAILPTKDRTVEYEALQYLHGLLDEDASGYIDVEESVDFLHDELNVKGKSKDRLSRLHQDDPQISVDELWGTWRLSEVHNWTVDQVVEWLSAHVELPQYAAQFRQHNVDGSQMPRMASNSPEFIASVLSIRDPIHKRKISLKATDAVLFGAPKRDFLGQYKEWILLASIGIATCGVWLAYMQKRKYETRMRQVSADLENIQQLERQLSSLQEKVGKSSTGSEGSTEETDKRAFGDNNRLQEAEEELAILRDALQRAEQRVESRQWTPPIELEILLRKTYSIEMENFKAKRAAAEKQLRGSKEECEKLYKKQQGVLGAFRIAHSSQLNTMDDGLVSAKQSLTELSTDMAERSARWCRVEIVTGLSIMGSNGKNRSPQAIARQRMSAAYAGSLDLEHDSVLPSTTTPSYTSERRVPSVYDFEDSNSVASFDSLPIDAPAISRPHRRVHPDKVVKQQSVEVVAPAVVNGRESSTPTPVRINERYTGQGNRNSDGAVPLRALPGIADMTHSPSGVSLAASQMSSEGGIDINKVKKKRFASMRKIFRK